MVPFSRERCDIFCQNLISGWILGTLQKQFSWNLPPILVGVSCCLEADLYRCVLIKWCSENIQQIYRRTSMPKCNFKKVECSPVNLLHFFRKPFPRTHLEGCNTEVFMMKIENITDNEMLYLIGKNFGFGFPHLLGQVLTLPTRIKVQQWLVIYFRNHSTWSTYQ